MNKQVELAKRLLESKGYTVTKKIKESHTVELYKTHTGDPERKRFSDYKSAKEFADSQKDNYEEIVITIPTAGGPSTVNSWSKSEGWYRKDESVDSEHFKVGDRVSYSMLYGGSVNAKVIKVTADNVTLREKWVAEDTGEVASSNTDYELHRDKEGREYIVVWEYHGEEGKVYPPGTFDESIDESSRTRVTKESLESEVKEAVKKVMISPRFGFPEEDVEDYSVVEVTDSKRDKSYKVEVRAEVSYEGLMDLCDTLNPIVEKYDSESYFEPVTSGIISAYVSY